ncbi:MAG: DUF3857 domain-containing protein, partial [Victivallales bacterium]|nr:DUF3857 domain-containing protein [Victivallales bacterium]
MRKNISILILLIAACSAFLHAQEIPAFLNVQEMLKMAQDVTKEKYPDADDALVDDYILTTYQADGTAVTFDDQAFKILTETGKNNNHTISLWFNESYGKAQVLSAKIYKPDGRVITIDVAKQTKVMVDRSQMSSNIYDPNEKVVTTTVPDLEIGDVLHFITRHEITKPRVPNTFSDYHTY